MLLTITVGLIDDKLESTTTAVAGPKFVKGKHFPLDLKGDFFQLRAQIGVQVIGFSALFDWAPGGHTSLKFEDNFTLITLSSAIQNTHSRCL